MKIQTIINCVFAVAFVGYVVSQLNPTFDTITCKTWRVVDKDGKLRIDASTLADGSAGVALHDKHEIVRITASTGTDGNSIMAWFDKSGNVRIDAGTFDDGDALVQLHDKDRKLRIDAHSYADGTAGVAWRDKDENPRIMAGTRDGTVVLPTEVLTPPKKP